MLTENETREALSGGATLVMFSRWPTDDSKPDAVSLGNGARVPVPHATAEALLKGGALDFYGGCTETAISERWYRLRSQP